jgi:predicted O-methyltransferase YrrM
MLSKLIEGGRRVLDQERLIRDSDLFDDSWYAETYQEVSGKDAALAHYLKTGAAKGYDPGPRFSTQAYLSDYPDVRQAGANALLHYLRFGQAEGRRVRDVAGLPSGAAAHKIGDAAIARLRDAFDPEFYLKTNPDLPGETDAFQHFMSVGWRQRRDPVSWFSVEQYLRTQGDVAATDQNPFEHFLLTGCQEGRAVSRSAKLSFTQVMAPKTRPRTTVVAMVKNEADIIRTFTRHVLGLFDDIVIVDHGSDDGTAEYLDTLATVNRRVEVLTLTEPSYIQSVTMTHILQDRPQARDADWVFFLDADEFLPFRNRDEFHDALARFSRCPVLSMAWQNLIPETYWDGDAAFTKEDRFFVAPVPSPYCKIALQPARVSLDCVVVAQGNHSLLHTQNGLPIQAFEADFPLLHLPVRSVDQLLLKLNQGVLAYQKIGSNRDKGQGTHWYQMKKATEDEALTPDHLNAVAARYSEDKPDLRPVSLSTLSDWGYKPVSYDLAVSADEVSNDVTKRSLGEVLMRLYAQDFTDAVDEDCTSAVQLVTEDGRLRRTSKAAEYDALPRIKKKGVNHEMTEILSALFRPGYKPIEDLVPSDWAGHIPFMFGLVDLLQPRRYVELGTLRGASFFAYAQAARDIGFKTEAIAVSPWAVEDERASEYQGVFDDFAFIARKYSDFTGYLRLAPDDARHRFADNSIDLLKLDGFYGYEELAKTLRDWVPKLSNRGVILLHDIHAHDGGFGVWRVWDELKAQYPSFAFRHAQGLGVACVGTQVAPDLVKLAETMTRDPALQTLLQEHFESQGALSAELFSRRFDMARMEWRGAAEAAGVEELSKVKQELATAQAEATDLRLLIEEGAERAAV